MRQSHISTQNRAGFTIVELLVVISIITILMTLITYAALSALAPAKDLQVQAEITSRESLGRF
ncbi:MAG: type II secretion system protein [Planctomycetaceae bacterium]